MKLVNFFKNDLWKGIFFMGTGTVMAQLINVLAQPILTRIVPAEILGIYTYIVSMATIVIPVASLKMDMLIVSEANEEKAQYVTDLCFGINIIVSVLYAIIIYIGYHVSEDNLFNKYGMIIFLVPILVWTNGLRFLFISYNNRYKKYKLISEISIVREGVRALIQIGSGILNGGAFGLSLGYALSPLFGMRLQMKGYIKRKKERQRIQYKDIKEIISTTGKRQLLYLVPAQFINSFSASLITISITSLFTAKALGYYSAGVRVLDIPIIFISSNVSKVCYQCISENVAAKKPIFKLFLSITGVLIVVSGLGFGVLYLTAPFLSELFFGSGYSIAGEYIRCLCGMYAVRLVATSFAGIYTIFHKQNFELFLNILLIIMAGIAYAIANYLNWDILGYLNVIGLGYMVIYILMLMGYVILSYRFDKVREVV